MPETAVAETSSQTPPAEQHGNWKPQANPWLIAATVALAAFMEVLDTSIANVALPHIAGNLGASTDQGTWVLTSYLVSNAIILPCGAWASSVIGRRNFFMLCIVIFTVSSFLCGIAPSLPILLVCRVFQGIGGGGLQPMAQAIMADSFEEKKRGQAFALYGLVAVLAPSIGPTIGGWITDNYSWRWIFYINIPVGLLALVLTQRLVQDPPWIKPDRKNLLNLDYIGLGLLTVAMGGLQIMLDKGEENDWFASNFIRTFGLMFVVGIIGLIWWEWQKKNPLMNLKLFKFKNFAICFLLMMLVGGVLNAATVLQPQFLQQLLGYTATNAGLALTAGGIALVVVMPMAGIATGKFAARNLAAVGFAFFAAAYYYVSTHVTLDMSFGEASFLRVLQMVPIPFCFISITNAAYVGLPKEASNQVSGLINFARNVGGSIFIAVTGALVTNRSLFHQAQLQNHMSYANPQYQQQSQALSSYFGSTGPGAAGGGGMNMAHASIYQQLNQQAAAMGYMDVYRMLCWMSCLMVLCAFLLSKNRRAREPPLEKEPTRPLSHHVSQLAPLGRYLTFRAFQRRMSQTRPSECTRRKTMALQDVLIDELRDMYSAENQLVKALPKLAKGAKSGELKQLFTAHLDETKEQVVRLRTVFEHLGKKPTGKHCNGMEGVIKEGKEALEEDVDDASFDSGLIGAALRTEHYEIAGYTACIAIANKLGLTDAVALLQQNLDEELAAAQKIQAASGTIFDDAMGEEEEDEDEEPESEKPAKEKAAERKSKQDEKAAAPEVKKRSTGK